jgi:hypothetical protein
MHIRSAIACLAVAPLFVGAAPEPTRLQPNSPWVVDYGQDRCRLIRGFSSGTWDTTFVLESRAPGDVDLLITGKPMTTTMAVVPAKFLPVGGKMFYGNAVLTAGTKAPAILWSTVRMYSEEAIEREVAYQKQRRPKGVERPLPLDLKMRDQLKADREKFAAGATALEILPRGNRAVILETGSLGAPIKTFDKCVRDLSKSWGIDPDMEDKIVRPVYVLPGRWLMERDYPAAMIRGFKESEVSVRLLIDATGKITKCTALSHFAASDFNSVTCNAITSRARFLPAELADGMKVPSYIWQRVVFRIGY